MEIKSSFYHVNINVTELARSIEFYAKTLGLTPYESIKAEDGAYEIVYLKDSASSVYLELTWLADHPEKYELGENETHICYCISNDYDKAREYYRELGCLCYENEDMGLYFIEDPDGYWIEILPDSRRK